MPILVPVRSGQGEHRRGDRFGFRACLVKCGGDRPIQVLDGLGKTDGLGIGRSGRTPTDDRRLSRRKTPREPGNRFAAASVDSKNKVVTLHGL